MQSYRWVPCKQVQTKTSLYYRCSLLFGWHLLILFSIAACFDWYKAVCTTSLYYRLITANNGCVQAAVVQSGVGCEAPRDPSEVDVVADKNPGLLISLPPWWRLVLFQTEAKSNTKQQQSKLRPTNLLLFGRGTYNAATKK